MATAIRSLLQTAFYPWGRDILLLPSQIWVSAVAPIKNGDGPHGNIIWLSVLFASERQITGGSVIDSALPTGLHLNHCEANDRNLRSATPSGCRLIPWLSVLVHVPEAC